jgi:pectate lyase
VIDEQVAFGQLISTTTTFTNVSIQARGQIDSFTGVPSLFALGARIQPDASGYRGGEATTQVDKEHQLIRFDAGSATATTLAHSAAIALNAGDARTLRLDADGPSLSFFVDGTLATTAMDATYASGAVELDCENDSATFSYVAVYTLGG